MKKIIIIVLMLFLSGCTMTEKDNTLKIKYTNEEMIVDDVISLLTDIEKLSTEYKNSDIKWTSSDEKIASVEGGVVIALATGEVTITAQVGNYIAEKTLVINPKPVKTVLSITGVNTVIVGDTIQLEVLINTNFSNSSNWESEDDSIATVDQFGLVTAHKAGLVKITANSTAMSNLKAEHMVYVKNAPGTVDYIKNEIINTIYELNGDFDLTYLNDKTVNLVKNNKDAVVGVSNYKYGKDSYGASTGILNRAGIGTGAIYKKEAIGDTYKYTLITNHHVIDKADAVKVYLGYLDIEVNATLIRTSPELDLAIVEFTDVNNINPLEFGESTSFETGDFVIAIGNSNGYEYFGSVTFGIISEKERSLNNEDAIFIQHTAAINPGNSGGPLFSLDGKIVGINTLKIASSDIDNMGFSISVTTVLDFLEE